MTSSTSYKEDVKQPITLKQIKQRIAMLARVMFRPVRGSKISYKEDV